MGKTMRIVIFILLIIVILFMMKLIINPSKGINISEIESIKKPEGVVDIKLQSEENSHNIVFIVEDMDKDLARKIIEDVISRVNNEKDNMIIEIHDKNNITISFGFITMGENKIIWQ